MITRKVKYLFPIIIFILLFFTFSQFSSWYENKLQKEENKSILSELKAHSTTIKESIDKRFILLGLLKSYILQNIDSQNTFDMNNIELNNYAKTLINSVEGIKVLQVSPKGIHTFVYPLIGNEETLNKNLFKDKRVDVINMLEVTKNSKKIIANAPYELVQGGFGLVARQAITHKGEFWGFVVMVLDMSYILEEAGFTQEQTQLDISIFQNQRYIFGNKNLINNKYQSIPLKIANQKLTLLATKKESLYSTTLLFINISIFLIALLSSFLIYILLNKQIKLEGSVTETLKELEDKNNELETIIQEAPNPMLLHEEGGKVLMMNQAWSNSSGFSLEEIPTINDWIENTRDDEEIKNFMKEHINSLYEITEKVDEGEFVFFNKKRHLLTWQVSSAPLGLIKGKKLIITSAMDITELKENQKILLQQSKLASIGEMLENIAHQWRQPLSVISAASTGILVEIEADILKQKDLVTSMKLINQATQHLSTTIDYFRNFLINSNERELINLENTIEKTMNILSSKLKNKEINIVLKIDNISYECAENEIIQVIMNLLSNSQDALEKVVYRRMIFIDIFKENNNIILKVKDNAGGIPENIIEKVFDPYFTTKHQSQGTGIGLYITEEIITKHLNGKIFVKNKEFTYEGKSYIGAQFTIKLPLS